CSGNAASGPSRTFSGRRPSWPGLWTCPASSPANTPKTRSARISRRRSGSQLPGPSNGRAATAGARGPTRRVPSGRTGLAAHVTEAGEQRGGSTPFNLLPIAAGGNAAANGHPAKTPYEVAAWWVKYLLPPQGVLLDCFAGSGTMLSAGLDYGASKVI